MSRLKRDKDHAMETILDAALSTIAKLKISGTGMRDIARTAGMSQSNLHYHFDSKTKLYDALLDKIDQDWFKETRKRAVNKDCDASEKLRILLEEEMNFMQDHLDFYIAYNDFSIHATSNENYRKRILMIYALWRTDLEAVMTRILEDQDRDIRESKNAASMFIYLVEGISSQYIISPNAINLQEEFEKAYEMLRCFLASRPTNIPPVTPE
jgi:AcrR family transcriptional regulator